MKTPQLGDFDDTAYSNIPVGLMAQQKEKRFPEKLEYVDRNWRYTSSGILNRFCFQFVQVVFIDTDSDAPGS